MLTLGSVWKGNEHHHPEAKQPATDVISGHLDMAIFGRYLMDGHTNRYGNNSQTNTKADERN